VVVVDKYGGDFKGLHTVGIAHSEEETGKLLVKGQKRGQSQNTVGERQFYREKVLPLHP